MADFPNDLNTQTRATELVESFADCRPDMHEPDEQGWRIAMISGTKLGNAGVQGEQVLQIRNEDGSWFEANICDLLALARLGAQYVLGEMTQGQDLWVFWEYDLPPYVLGHKAAKLAEDGSARAYVPAYQDWKRYKWILPGEQGRRLKEALDEEKGNVKRRCMALKLHNKQSSARILREHGCTPSAKLEEGK